MLPLKGALPYEPLSDNPDEFGRWKISRRRIIKEIDKTILNRTDSDLEDYVNNWLEIANDNKDFSQPISILKGLMHLSIYYHYHHDYTSIQTYVPLIHNFISHPKRCVARVATRVLWWLAEESSENIDYFHTIVSEVPKWLELPLSDQLVYSALCILHNAYGYADNLCNGYVAKAFPKLIEASFSEDKELQHITLSVIKHHLMSQRPKDLGYWFNFCIEQINTGDPHKIRSALYVCALFFEFSYGLNSDIFLTVLNKQVNRATSKEIVECLYKMSINDVVDYRKPSFANLYLSLLTTNHPLLTKITERIPSTIQIKFNNYKPLNGKIDSPVLYSLVSVIQKKFPSFLNKFNIVPDPTFSKEFLQLLRNNVPFRFQMNQKMTQFCLQQLNQQSSETALLAALRIIKYFGQVLFNKTDSQPTEQILNLLHSSNELIRVSATKAIIYAGTPVSNPILVRIALFDTSSKVRLAAIKHLRITDDILESRSTSQLLNDTNIDVKLAALKFVSSASQHNPIMFYPELFRFVSQAIEVLAGMTDFYEIANYSRLFPAIASLIVESYQPIIPQLTQFCLLFLSRGNFYSQNNNYYVAPDNLIPLSEQSPSLRTEIFGSLYSTSIDERDVNLIKSLKAMANYLEPHSATVIEVLGSMIIAGRKDPVVMAAVSCLRKMVIHIPSNENFALKYPNISNKLFNILAKTPNEKLAVKIMKLFGAAGVATLPNYQEVSDATFALVDVDKPDFVITALLEAVTKRIEQHPPSVFDFVKSSFRNEPQHSIKYASRIIPALISALSTSTAEQLDHLFSILGEITLIVGHKMDEYIERIAPLLAKNLNLKSCADCSTSLSYILNSSMTPFMPPIFSKAISLIVGGYTQNCKSLFKLISFSVLFQNQPMHQFIKACESYVHVNPTIVVKEFTRLIQNSVTAPYYGSHMWRIVSDILPWLSRDSVLQLLYSLIIFRGLDTNTARRIAKTYKIEDANLDSLLNQSPSERMFNGPPPFVKKKTAVVTLLSHHVIITPKSNPLHTVFSEVRSPLTTNLSSWMIDLANKCVNRSPNYVIRDCQKLINDSAFLRGKILPIAFISCWLQTSQSQKDCFFAQLREAFSLGQSVMGAVYRIIDLLEMLGVSHGVPDKSLADYASSPWRSIFYMRRLFISSGENVDLEPMLERLYKMGRIATIRGILDVAGHKMIPLRCAYWRERVLDFNGSLKLYHIENSLPNVIGCYAGLERWEEVRALYPVFEDMAESDKIATSGCFASAFYYNNQMDVVDKLLQYFPRSDSLRLGFVKILTLIRENRLEEARATIKEKYRTIVQSREIFGGTNVHMAFRHLIFAQHLSELSEVVSLKMQNKMQIPITWERHLLTFKGKGRDWRELSDIRNLMTPATQEDKVALKMAVALRKDKQWGIINGIHKRIVVCGISHELFLERIKAQWAQGFRETALQKINFLLKCLLAKKTEIDEIINAMPQSAHDDLSEIWKNDTQKNFKNFLTSNAPKASIVAAVIRTVVAWRIRDGLKDDEDIKSVCGLLKYSIDRDKTNQRAYFYFGYTCMRLMQTGQNDNDLAGHCINAFLNSPSLMSISLMTWAISKLIDYHIASRIDTMKIPKEAATKLLPRFIKLLSSENSAPPNIAKRVIVRVAFDFQRAVYPLRAAMDNRDAREMLTSLCNTGNNAAINTDATFLTHLLMSKATTKKERAEAILAKIIELQCSNDKELEECLNVLDSLKNTSEDNDLSNDIIKIVACLKTGQPEAFLEADKMREKWRKSLKFEVNNKFSNQKEADVKWRSFCVSVPGSPAIMIESVIPIISIINTASRPRVVEMVGDGMKFRFLLTAASLLNDERIATFCDIMAAMMDHSNLREIAPKAPRIFPLCVAASLIKITAQTETMESIMSSFSAKRKQELDEISSHLGSTNPSTLSALQNVEMCEKLSRISPGEELLECIWRSAPAVSRWVRTSDAVTQSYAGHAVFGYIAGLENRHPGNILLEKDTGLMSIIDFSSIFRKSRRDPKRAEQVPIRMTRAIRNLMDGANPYGLFQLSCEKIMEFLWERRPLVMMQLMVALPDTPPHLLEYVNDRLRGIDSAIDEQKITSASEQVSKLIEAALDPINTYSMHFEWKPYW